MPRNIQVARVKMFKAAAKGEKMAGVKSVPMREDDEPKRTLDPKVIVIVIVIVIIILILILILISEELNWKHYNDKVLISILLSSSSLSSLLIIIIIIDIIIYVIISIYIIIIITTTRCSKSQKGTTLNPAY